LSVRFAVSRRVSIDEGDKIVAPNAYGAAEADVAQIASPDSAANSERRYREKLCGLLNG